ncbi:hypothetical protein [Propionibacterium sp. oral taxon 192]|uniref:hypothetical protein n=1 Tax=Propionibacterium sp. oral taxon 192 TaxID=671222 RepID=UPI0012EC6EE7|nr:hypothetical protein [Propionibacterium sp. oral taxon 192]
MLVILVDPPQVGQPPFICRCNGDKKLPNDFPFDAMDDAIGWSNLAGSEVTGINELPPFPGSGMPALLNALGLSSGDTALT